MKIITHSGIAHRDEFLACGLAAAAGLVDDDVCVERREPTLQEIADPEVLVLDVGHTYNPRKRSFDHHQKEAEVRNECALSLLAKSLQYDENTTYDELLGTESWYRLTKQIDSNGPESVLQELSLQAFPYALKSPVEEALLHCFESNPQPHVVIAKEILRYLISQAVARKAAYDTLDERATLGKIASLRYLYTEVYNKHPRYIPEWLKARGLQVGVTITPDPVGAGWSVYCLPPAQELLDLSIPKGGQIIFQRSHLLKTRNKIELKKVLLFIRQALK